jgi:ATPase family protein associated with various cellular activities (AAA)
MDIVSENLYAVQAAYFAWQLEQMRVFDVVDRIAKLYGEGLLPVGCGSAAETLQRRAASDDERPSRRERAMLYAAALGVPGGEADDIEPNREFPSLWLRFLAAVALHADKDPQRVRCAAQRLAVNASAHGAKLGAVVARLATDADKMLSVLCAPEIAQAFGVDDLWQVIDRVNAQELGGAVNTTRYRTRAQAGSAVLEWLADRADEPGGMTADADLVESVDQWLEVSGLEGGAMPAIARDLLHAASLSPEGDGRHGCALLCGPRGTGKTLAACVIAEALSLDLFRIDLSRVTSKYIGETEKNLRVVLVAAELADFVLFFDEADALFGKRTEIDDAHDRYANDEIALVLQALEPHKGLVLVATNVCPDAGQVLVSEWLRGRACRTIRFPRPKC